MKQAFALLIFVIGFAQIGMAQDKELESSKREQLEALKIAHITEKLALTPDEAQTFWPLYNEMEAKMQAVRKQRRKNRKDTKTNHDLMSDKELMAAVEKELDFEQQELDLKKEYNQKFSKIIPIKKVVLLHEAQEGFKRRLLKGAKEKRRLGPPPH
ncbi:MAG TPA: hypothetical protein DCR04_05410 [Flavobacteriales bacterium]|nr:hypothetical protein [Flavobacteriales bacterium]